MTAENTMTNTSDTTTADLPSASNGHGASTGTKTDETRQADTAADGATKDAPSSKKKKKKKRKGHQHNQQPAVAQVESTAVVTTSDPPAPTAPTEPAAGDPLVVRLPNVMDKIGDDPNLFGRNAVHLAATVQKYRAGEPTDPTDPQPPIKETAAPIEEPAAVPIEQPAAAPIEAHTAAPIEQPAAAPIEQPAASLRLRMKVWTDHTTAKRYLIPTASWRDIVNGQPVTDVMYAYALRDDDTKLVTLTAAEWNALPFFYFQEDGPTPRATAQPVDGIG